MLINNMNIKYNLDVEYTKNNDAEYIIIFKDKNSQLPYHSLTLTVGVNGLFHPHTTPGNTSLFSIFSNFQCYECYTGAHLILYSD